MSRLVPSIMIQGTGSNVGKSLLVAGLCRHFARQGLRVRPFKPQNMSNNAAAVEGGEIGRAQALQARAALVAPSVHMNPVLLKPESERRSQIIVQGKRFGELDAYAFRQRSALMPFVLDSFAQVGADADLIIVEGAGSPAETNLRRDDIANMGFAHAANVPVLLAGDIDRGGVIASLVGTHTVLDQEDRNRIRGFLVNKFRGDISLFDEGMRNVEDRTGWPGFGVVPWFFPAQKLPAEDAVDIASSRRAGAPVKVVVPCLPRIANFDDLDPLKLDSAIDLRMISPGSPLPLDADLIVIPGSKATIADLAFLRHQGWDIDIAAHVRRGGHVLGLCGGYQMLGRTIADPNGIEGEPGVQAGLGYLEVDTVLTEDKIVRPVSARHLASGLEFDAYEIHLGDTTGDDTSHAPFHRNGKAEGAASRDGRIVGTYLHGLFTGDAFREAYLANLVPGRVSGTLSYDIEVESTLDALAEHLAAHLDTARMLAIARARL